MSENAICLLDPTVSTFASLGPRLSNSPAKDQSDTTYQSTILFIIYIATKEMMENPLKGWCLKKPNS
jgi:hypothetical protein